LNQRLCCGANKDADDARLPNMAAVNLNRELLQLRLLGEGIAERLAMRRQ
jgi:cell division protein ZapA (FtsZ GTPase activity inhibitor)